MILLTRKMLLATHMRWYLSCPKIIQVVYMMKQRKADNVHRGSAVGNLIEKNSYEEHGGGRIFNQYTCVG